MNLRIFLRARPSQKNQSEARRSPTFYYIEELPLRIKIPKRKYSRRLILMISTKQSIFLVPSKMSPTIKTIKKFRSEIQKLGFFMEVL